MIDSFITQTNMLAYIGHCPLPEVYLTHTTFRDLALLMSSDGCNYTDKIELYFYISGDGWDRTRDLLCNIVVRVVLSL
jgi:hypothetical protein